MKILLIGQMTLHWGRVEFGNIGNYYIIEPFIRELHRVFPGVEIKTTLQMSDAFCLRENIARLPMELYYSWEDSNYLDKAIKELGIAELYNKSNHLFDSTQYINEVLDADMVIDLSGDIWGDNANFLGENRFVIGLIKNRIAQLLGKKTVMLAGSPGPFGNSETKDFAKLVYESFDLVTNREAISTNLLEKQNFDISNTKSLACPAFLFEPNHQIDLFGLYEELGVNINEKNIGFIMCGWNLLKGPFDRWPIEDDELLNYVELIENFIKNNDNTNVVLISHSNGFDLPPYFKLKHGRDFPYAKQLFDIIVKRKNIDIKKIVLQEKLLNAWDIKAFIGSLDMLISGRIHAAVAAMSQFVPTIIIDYGHEPKAHKLKGFARVAGMEHMVVDPQDEKILYKKVDYCLKNLENIKKELESNIPKVKNLSRQNFDLLKKI